MVEGEEGERVRRWEYCAPSPFLQLDEGRPRRWTGDGGGEDRPEDGGRAVERRTVEKREWEGIT